MLKVTWSLSRAGLFDEIHLVGTLEQGLPEREVLDGIRSIWRVPTPRSSGIGGRVGRLALILEWALGIFRAYCRSDLRAVSCHNLVSLPLGVALRITTGALLVYDTHELETERTGWSFPVRVMAKFVERLSMPWVDYSVVVSESIGSWYSSRYPNKTFRVVRNVPLVESSIPEGRKGTDLRVACGVPDGAICYLMQGTLGQGRGIEALVEAFSSTTADAWLVLLGFPESAGYKRELDRLLKRSHRVAYHPSVPPGRLLEYTRTADVGIYAVEPASLSYKLTVGNKLFEYLMAGLPVVGSDFPEIRRILKDNGCGWTLPIRTDSIRRFIERLDPMELSERKRNVEVFRRDLSWQKEASKMIQDYDDLMEVPRE